MFLLFCIFAILCCFAFCYLTFKILELEKDVETLYKNYDESIRKMIDINLKRCNKYV